MDLNQFIAFKVRTLRRERRWTQEELAETLAEYGIDIHSTAVSRIEAAKRGLRVEELLALASSFGVPHTELLPKHPTVERCSHNAAHVQKAVRDHADEILRVFEEAVLDVVRQSH